jgi:hypothetical protein
MAADPCTRNLDSTAISSTGAGTPEPASVATNSPFDCFYVYPTVSNESADNADLKIQAAEVNAAVEQASRFSQVCDVWAPMYRQRTLSSLANGAALGSDPSADDVAYESVLAGWKDYLANDNHGRPIIFIGHSQGAAMLIRLLESQVDPNPAVRKLLVSAIILGGNVTVPQGKDVGSTFHNIPACRSDSQTGCVIAYSSFLQQPPTDTLFGKPGTGVSLQSGQTATAGLQVLCTNPAALAGGTGALLPYFGVGSGTIGATKLTTPWVSFPGLYTAQCESSDGITWLQVHDLGTPSDPRPRATAAQGPAFGIHMYDVNIALGNLVADVRSEEAAYHPG